MKQEPKKRKETVAQRKSAETLPMENSCIVLEREQPSEHFYGQEISEISPPPETLVAEPTLPKELFEITPVAPLEPEVFPETARPQEREQPTPCEPQPDVTAAEPTPDPRLLSVSGRNYFRDRSVMQEAAEIYREFGVSPPEILQETERETPAPQQEVFEPDCALPRERGVSLIEENAESEALLSLFDSYLQSREGAKASEIQPEEPDLSFCDQTTLPRIAQEADLKEMLDLFGDSLQQHEPEPAEPQSVLSPVSVSVPGENREAVSASDVLDMLDMFLQTVPDTPPATVGLPADASAQQRPEAPAVLAVQPQAVSADLFEIPEYSEVELPDFLFAESISAAQPAAESTVLTEQDAEDFQYDLAFASAPAAENRAEEPTQITPDVLSASDEILPQQEEFFMPGEREVTESLPSAGCGPAALHSVLPQPDAEASEMSLAAPQEIFDPNTPNEDLLRSIAQAIARRAEESFRAEEELFAVPEEQPKESECLSASAAAQPDDFTASEVSDHPDHTEAPESGELPVFAVTPTESDPPAFEYEAPTMPVLESTLTAIEQVVLEREQHGEPTALPAEFTAPETPTLPETEESPDGIEAPEEPQLAAFPSDSPQQICLPDESDLELPSALDETDRVPEYNLLQVPILEIPEPETEALQPAASGQELTDAAFDEPEAASVDLPIQVFEEPDFAEENVSVSEASVFNLSKAELSDTFTDSQPEYTELNPQEELVEAENACKALTEAPESLASKSDVPEFESDLPAEPDAEPEEEPSVPSGNEPEEPESAPACEPTAEDADTSSDPAVLTEPAEKTAADSEPALPYAEIEQPLHTEPVAEVQFAYVLLDEETVFAEAPDRLPHRNIFVALFALLLLPLRLVGKVLRGLSVLFSTLVTGLAVRSRRRGARRGTRRAGKQAVRRDRAAEKAARAQQRLEREREEQRLRQERKEAQRREEEERREAMLLAQEREELRLDRERRERETAAEQLEEEKRVSRAMELIREEELRREQLRIQAEQTGEEPAHEVTNEQPETLSSTDGAKEIESAVEAVSEPEIGFDGTTLDQPVTEDAGELQTVAECVEVKPAVEAQAEQNAVQAETEPAAESEHQFEFPEPAEAEKKSEETADQIESESAAAPEKTESAANTVRESEQTADQTEDKPFGEFEKPQIAADRISTFAAAIAARAQEELGTFETLAEPERETASAESTVPAEAEQTAEESCESADHFDFPELKQDEESEAAEPEEVLSVSIRQPEQPDEPVELEQPDSAEAPPVREEIEDYEAEEPAVTEDSSAALPEPAAEAEPVAEIEASKPAVEQTAEPEVLPCQTNEADTANEPLLEPVVPVPEDYSVDFEQDNEVPAQPVKRGWRLFGRRKPKTAPIMQTVSPFDDPSLIDLPADAPQDSILFEPEDSDTTLFASQRRGAEAIEEVGETADAANPAEFELEPAVQSESAQFAAEFEPEPSAFEVPAEPFEPVEAVAEAAAEPEEIPISEPESELWQAAAEQAVLRPIRIEPSEPESEPARSAVAQPTPEERMEERMRPILEAFEAKLEKHRAVTERIADEQENEYRYAIEKSVRAEARREARSRFGKVMKTLLVDIVIRIYRGSHHCIFFLSEFADWAGKFLADWMGDARLRIERIRANYKVRRGPNEQTLETSRQLYVPEPPEELLRYQQQEAQEAAEQAAEQAPEELPDKQVLRPESQETDE